MSDLFNLFNELDSNTHSKNRDEILKPPFGYPGGKSKSVGFVLPHLPQTPRYVEVFGGSGAVLLARNASKLEVFNDRYSGVTDFYRCIRDKRSFDELCERLDLTLHSREDWLLSKKAWTDSTDPIERAACWYMMVEYSFGSLGRNFGRSISPRTRFAGSIRRKLSRFAALHERLSDVQIENQDWEVIMRDFDAPDTVFYLDPPYVDAHKGTYKHEMTLEDHNRLLDTVFSCEGFVALSGYDNPLMNGYDWDDKHEWTLPTSMKAMSFTENNFKDKFEADRTRGHVTECLWIKEAHNVE